MFFRQTRKMRTYASDVMTANVHIPVRLGHRDAKRLFTDPLDNKLKAAKLGSVLETSMRTRNSGLVLGVDLTLNLHDTSKPALKKVVELLEALTVPHGSSIRLSSSPGTPMIFGQAEGLELLVDPVFAKDADARRDLTKICGQAIDDIAVNRGWRANETSTSFYFYGDAFHTMEERLAAKLASHPEYGEASLRRLA